MLINSHCYSAEEETRGWELSTVHFDFNRKAFLTYQVYMSQQTKNHSPLILGNSPSNSVHIFNTLYPMCCKRSQSKRTILSSSPFTNAQGWINCPELAFNKQIPLRSTKTESGQKTGLTGAKSTRSHQFMMHKWVNGSRVRWSIASRYTSACWWPRTRQLKCSILQNYHSLPCMVFTDKSNLVRLFIRKDLYTLSKKPLKKEHTPAYILNAYHRGLRSACRRAEWFLCCCCTQTHYSGGGGTLQQWSLQSAPPCWQA